MKAVHTQNVHVQITLGEVLELAGVDYKKIYKFDGERSAEDRLNSLIYDKSFLQVVE